MKKSLQTIAVICIICFSLFTFNFSYSQTCEWAIKAGGSGWDYGQSITTDVSGNVYIAGSFTGSATFGSTTLNSVENENFYVAKYNNAGICQWAINIDGGVSKKESAIKTDVAGNVYVTGVFRDTAFFGSTTLISSGGSDVFIAKYSNTGVLQWAIKSGGSSDDEAKSITTDVYGNVIITGYFNGTASFGSTSLTSSGSSDIFIAKYNNSGILLWAVKAGGSEYDASSAITTDVSGNIYVTGSFQGSVNFGATTLNSSTGNEFVVKYNDAGICQWALNFYSGNSKVKQAITTDMSGNIYISGGFSNTATFGSLTLTSAGESDVFIVKYNSAGLVQWGVKAGGTEYEGANNITCDTYGNIYVTGSFQGSANFGSTTLVSSGDDDVFITKYNSSGINQWALKVGG
ncbi:MAG: hypothetical protein Q8880_12600, partial [Bacteroidota bacterium]|nr:hypothetical protein [Bacteroidota bacterium]